MNLRLQLHLNIQIQIQPQPQLLVLPFFLLLLPTITTQHTPNSFTRRPRSPIHSIPGRVLDKVACLVRTPETGEGSTVALLLAGTALPTGALCYGGCIHFAAVDVFCVGVLSVAWLRARSSSAALGLFGFGLWFWLWLWLRFGVGFWLFLFLFCFGVGLRLGRVLFLLCVCVLGWLWFLLWLFLLRRCSLALVLGFLVRAGRRLRLVLLVCHCEGRKRRMLYVQCCDSDNSRF